MSTESLVKALQKVGLFAKENDSKKVTVGTSKQETKRGDIYLNSFCIIVSSSDFQAISLVKDVGVLRSRTQSGIIDLLVKYYKDEKLF